jgi:uncharacterized protein involved in high-affinity Fe2+ transport
LYASGYEVLPGNVATFLYNLVAYFKVFDVVLPPLNNGYGFSGTNVKIVTTGHIELQFELESGSDESEQRHADQYVTDQHPIYAHQHVSTSSTHMDASIWLSPRPTPSP